MKKIVYSKLRPDVLANLVSDRGIECKPNKTDMIRHLELDDNGKYIRKTTYEKINETQYIIGIDLKNHNDLVEIGKLVEKNQAKRMEMYSGFRLYYISELKLTNIE